MAERGLPVFEYSTFIDCPFNIFVRLLASSFQLLLRQAQEICASVASGEACFYVYEVLHTHISDQMGNLRLGVDLQPLSINVEAFGTSVQISQSLSS